MLHSMGYRFGHRKIQFNKLYVPQQAISYILFYQAILDLMEGMLKDYGRGIMLEFIAI